MTTSPSSASFPGDATPAQLLYGDLAQELASTRRLLERVPDGQADWKPAEKSMALGRLANHLAELPRFAALLLSTDELDWQTYKYVPLEMNSSADRVAAFDTTAAEMTKAVEGASWPTLAGEWTMRSGDQIIIKDRKATLIRTLGLSHMAHHRAQLGVYLRQLGIAIPGMYGPSADEM
jgi:uncharacterized damage-inducible protein DinB